VPGRKSVAVRRGHGADRPSGGAHLDDRVRPSRPYRSAMPGYIGLAAGGALGALAAYLFLHDPPISRGPRVTIAPLDAGAMVGVAMGF